MKKKHEKFPRWQELINGALIVLVNLKTPTSQAKLMNIK